MPSQFERHDALVQEVQGAGGIWTPGALLGETLIKRLQANAGLTFRAG